MSDSDDPDDPNDWFVSQNKLSKKSKKKKIPKKETFGRIFPGGNWNDVIELTKYCVQHKIKGNVYLDGKGGAAFLFNRKEEHKFPSWEGDTFFPIDEHDLESGFSIFDLDLEILKHTDLYDI